MPKARSSRPSPICTGANRWVWLAGHLFADLKMMAIFSMLFGAGIVLMTTRQESKGLGTCGVHYRRMGWLLLIGLIHAYLIWPGDILVIPEGFFSGDWLITKSIAWRETFTDNVDLEPDGDRQSCL